MSRERGCFLRKDSRQSLRLFLFVFLFLLYHPFPVAGEEKKAFFYLEKVMDAYHATFDVYTDHDAGGNHFYPTGWLGDTGSLVLQTDSTENVFSGTTCLKVVFQAAGGNWVSLYWQEPENNWASLPGAGYDLTGASRLTFWARGKNGGEKVEFFAGGLTGPYPDSFPKVSTGWLTLNSFWTRYSLDLTGKNLSHVIGGFGFTVTGAGNSGGATFYLDDIRYELDRKQQPRFLRSYQPVSPQAPDRFFSSTCFIYDNALALLAFLSRGTPEDLARAGLIADAFLLAQANDRFYQDGRLRNSYRSGDVLDHLTGKARLPGWWDSAQQRWCEDERQVSTDTGNLAWVIIGLVHYYRKNPQMKYLQAAITLGEWIHQHTCSPGGGYTAGYAGWEPQPVKLTYKSTEHNIDLYVAFKLLKEVTGQDLWQERSQHARNFVLSMWNQEGNHFWVGTREDGLTPDTSRKVLDVNTWAVMALKDYYQCVPWLEENFWCQDDIWSGFDFNDDRDGIWFEGTSQMALVYQLTEQPEKFLQVITSLRQVQHHGPNGDGLGIIAASRDGLTTGLSWQYFSRLHLGATCWYLLAERAFNPYWAELIRLRGDLNGDRQIDLVDIIICLRMALGLLEVDLYQADLTQDNLVDILDVITTLTLVLKWN